MALRKPLVSLVLPAITLGNLAAFLPIQSAQADQIIQITGSSTVYPITARAIKRFQASGQGQGANFSLKETGSSAGFRDFCSGRAPMANASRPISLKEIEACKARGIRFIELPIAFDAITVTVNPKNTWVSTVTTKELSRLWRKASQGKIMFWNQVNHDFPNQPIKLCGPGKDSGTFDIFNKAINKSTTNTRTDYTASEDDNVLVQCVANHSNALGYFGYGYFKKNSKKLKALKIVNPSGNPILPSVSSVQKELYQPLSRPLFLYVNDSVLSKNKLFRNFVASYLRQAESLVEASNYIPLPSRTYRLVESKLYRHILGTSFGGDIPVGLTIGQVLERSFDQHKKPSYR